MISRTGGSGIGRGRKNSDIPTPPLELPDEKALNQLVEDKIAALKELRNETEPPKEPLAPPDGTDDLVIHGVYRDEEGTDRRIMEILGWLGRWRK